ncbi:hypothetical protein AB5I41_07045 [Sphingomonas sp. MMS24-JH45]
MTAAASIGASGRCSPPIEARGEELALTALSTNYRRNDQALSRYYQARQGVALRVIDAALDGIIADKRALLHERTQQAMAAVRRTTLTAKILAAAGVALVLGAILLGGLAMRAIGERVLAQSEAEDERRRADELATAVTEATDALRVQEAQLRQSQKMDAVGKLTGGIAHDLDNMLAVIIGGLELPRRALDQGADQADIARHIDSAHEGAARAAALTRRLLGFARETTVDPEPVSAARLFANMADLLDRTLGDGVTVTFGCEPRLAYVDRSGPAGERPRQPRRQRARCDGRPRHAGDPRRCGDAAGRWRTRGGRVPGAVGRRYRMRAWRQRCWSACSNRSSRPSRSARGRDWGSASCSASRSSSAATCASTRRSAAAPR